MNLLNLPLEHFVANVVGMLVCLTVIFVCICRLNVAPMRRLWMTLTQIMYIAFGLWAAGTLQELWSGADIGWHGTAAGLGILLHLFITYRHWRVAESLARERRERELPECKRPLWVDEGDDGATTANR